MLRVDPFTQVSPICGILNDIKLREHQAQAAMRIAFEERHIVQFSTGKGKTHAAIAGVFLRFVKRDVTRVLWICPLAVVHKTVEALTSSTNLRVSVVRGIGSSVERFVMKELETCQVLVVNIEAFDNLEVLELFRNFRLSKFFDMVVVDEAHMIADPYGSNRNAVIYFLVLDTPIRVLLTATVLISRIDQYATLLALAERNLTEVFSYTHRVHAGEFAEGTNRSLLSFSRRQKNVPSFIVRFEDTTTVDSAPGVTIFKSTRGAYADTANNALINLVAEEGCSKFIVHCLLTSHHKFLQNLLQDTFGIRVGIVSGNSSQRDEVCRQFNEGELQCIVFSISTGLDMASDYVVMYDWNVYASQAIGRGLRTEEVGNYRIYFLLSTNAKEEALFLNSVVKTSELTKKAIGTFPINILY